MDTDGDRQFEIKVRGWPAVIILLIFVTTAIAYRVYLHRNLQIDPKARESIESTITARLYREILGDGKAVEQAIAGGDREAAEAIGRRIEGTSIEIHDLAMRGGGDEIVVRARYSVRGPEGTSRRTGYFTCSHSFLLGWVCKYEVSVWRWYIELF